MLNCSSVQAGKALPKTPSASEKSAKTYSGPIFILDTHKEERLKRGMKFEEQELKV